MEPVLIILLPGVIGGFILALLIARRRQTTSAAVVPEQRLDAPSPGLINMAHIRVEGVGGLGMVAAVVAVAVSDPRIRLLMIAAALLGIGLAFTLIAMRRRTGGMPSIGDGPEDGSLLHLDGERTRQRRPAPVDSSRLSLRPADGRA